MYSELTYLKGLRSKAAHLSLKYQIHSHFNGTWNIESLAHTVHYNEPSRLTRTLFNL